METDNLPCKVAELRVKLEERCGMSLGDRDIYLEGAALVDGQCVSELPLKHNSVLFVGACKTVQYDLHLLFLELTRYRIPQRLSKSAQPIESHHAVHHL